MPDQWHNRITGYGEEAPDTLLANPRNFRRHPKHQQDALAGVLRDVGVVQNVIVNRTTGLVVDGHARIALAIRDKQTTIPITYVELSEDEEALVLATLDPIAALATVDAEILENLLRDVTTGDAAVQAMLDALAVDAGIVPGLGEPGDGGDDFDTTPDDGPTRVQRGELWQLGNHRLLCGDSTNADDVARLMGGERAALCHADPPYGMNLDTDYTQMAEWANKQSGGKYEGFRRKGGSSKSINHDPVIGDDQPFDPSFIFSSFGYVKEMFLWGADYYADLIPNRTKGAWLVWDKREDKQGGNVDAMFGSSFELCWSKQPHKRDIIRARWAGYFGTETQDTRKRVHPTQKPLEVVLWIIERYANDNDLIADPFLGSGTTIIAAERTGRRCYGMEIEPKYCDVIIRRWEAETGRSAEKVG